MAVKETTTHLRKLLNQITSDLEKADRGNKAASQRVRTGTVKLEKAAKLYRKESIQFEKKNKGQRRPAAKKASASKPAKKSPFIGGRAKSAKMKSRSVSRPRPFAVKKKASKSKSKKSWLGKLF